MTWILISILAALAQTTRNSLQKQLKNNLSDTVASASRFIFGLPFIVIIYFIINKITGQTPQINQEFLINATIVSITQIIGTLLMVNLFSHKNFAVATTYVKTETIQTAIFGVVFFAEYLSIFGILAIIMGIIGIFLISICEQKTSFTDILLSVTKKHAIIGMLSGGLFAIGALFVKSATSSLVGTDLIINAVFTLLFMIIIQNIILLPYIFLKQKEQLVKLKQNIKIASMVGLASIIGSISWFIAFSLTTVAYVKVVGQVEIIFSILIAHRFFSEKQIFSEILGMILVLLSIILLIFE